MQQRHYRLTTDSDRLKASFPRLFFFFVGKQFPTAV